jgi:hypothetical protein
MRMLCRRTGVIGMRMRRSCVQAGHGMCRFSFAMQLMSWQSTAEGHQPAVQLHRTISIKDWYQAPGVLAVSAYPQPVRQARAVSSGRQAYSWQGYWSPAVTALQPTTTSTTTTSSSTSSMTSQRLALQHLCRLTPQLQ